MKTQLAAIDFDMEEADRYGNLRALLTKLCNDLSAQLVAHNLKITHYTALTPGGPIEMLTIFRLDGSPLSSAAPRDTDPRI